MFPILTLLFFCDVIFSNTHIYGWLYLTEYPLQFSVTLVGYIWFLVLLVILLWRRCGCYCTTNTTNTTTNSEDVEKTGSVLVRPDCVENIYENDLGLKSSLM